MRRLALWLSLALALVAMPLGTLAQTSPLAQVNEEPSTGAETLVTAEDGRAEAGLWTRTLIYIQDQQRKLHRELATAVKELRAEPSVATAWSLVVLSFLYGIFHAAGPGHGKAVISTYLLTHESQLRRGILLAVASSLMQAVTAVVLVQVFVALVGWTRRQAAESVGTLESVSFALIAGLGLYLILRAARALYRLARSARTQTNHHGHHAHGEDCCGHAHMPDPAQLSNPLTMKTAAVMTLSIGIRPCSGGVLVLIFAEVMNMAWAGVVAVFAMAIGTAITVSGLAALAVGSRNVARQMLSTEGRSLALVGHGVGLAGGLLIAAIGLSLFHGSLSGSHPLF